MIRDHGLGITDHGLMINEQWVMIRVKGIKEYNPSSYFCCFTGCASSTSVSAADHKRQLSWTAAVTALKASENKIQKDMMEKSSQN